MRTRHVMTLVVFYDTATTAAKARISEVEIFILKKSL